MWQLDKHSTEHNIDLGELDHALKSLMSCEVAANLFDITRPVSAGRAPGRLDVMGGIADYSGSVVLQLPLSESVWAFCQLCDSRVLTVVSALTQSNDSTNTNDAPRVFSCNIDQVVEYQQTQHKTKSTLKEFFAERGFYKTDNVKGNTDQTSIEWAAYIIGVLPILLQEYNIHLEKGLTWYLLSSVPEAKGVSSSAAIELASMRAVTHALQLDVSAEYQAVLAQRVENTVVGAPCGIMDQMTSSLGKKNQLLRLLCQPHDVIGHINIPNDIALWGIDSGLRHAVSGADYTSVRIATFMGYRILLKDAGIAEAHIPMHEINDTRWQGYLVNIDLTEFNRFYLQQLPQTLTGKEFLEQFCDHTDAVTKIEEENNYAVRTCTAHPVNEHVRVNAFAELLQSLACEDSITLAQNNASAKAGHSIKSRESVLIQLGDYMYQSHAGYTACGLNSNGTDDLVDMLREAGPASGIYGARITGGGSGGTVAVLARSDAGDTVRSIATRYAQKNGLGGTVFSSSSNGALACTLQPGTPD